MDKTPYISMVATAISTTFLSIEQKAQPIRVLEQQIYIGQQQKQACRREAIMRRITEGYKINIPIDEPIDMPVDPAAGIPTKINYKNVELLSSYTKPDIMALIHNFELVELRELLCVFIADIVQVIPEQLYNAFVINRVTLTLEIITQSIALYANSDVKNMVDMVNQCHELRDPYEQLKSVHEKQNTEFTKLQLEHDELREKFDALKKVLS